MGIFDKENLQKAASGGDFTPVPEGKYVARLEKVIRKGSASKPIYEAQLAIVDGEHKGRKIFENGIFILNYDGDAVSTRAAGFLLAIDFKGSSVKDLPLGTKLDGIIVEVSAVHRYSWKDELDEWQNVETWQKEYKSGEKVPPPSAKVSAVASYYAPFEGEIADSGAEESSSWGEATEESPW